MLFILNSDLQIINTLSLKGVATQGYTPYSDDYHTQALDTGAETFEFKTLANSKESENLVVGNYIAFRDDDGDDKLFNIIETSETKGNEGFIKYVYCEMHGIELRNSVVRPMEVTNASVEKFAETLLEGSDWTLGKVEDFGSLLDIKIEEHTSVYDAIQKYIIGEYGAEIYYTVELKANNVVNKYLNIVESRGFDRGVRFTYDKNMQDITRTIDVSDLCTALIGVGKDGLTFKSVEADDKPLNQDFIASETAYRQWSVNGNHIFGYENFETDSPQELLKLTRKKLEERCNPKVKYELNVELLGEEVGVGDYVKITDMEFSPAITLGARINVLTKSKSDIEGNTCEIANFVQLQSNITEEMRKLSSTLKGYADNVTLDNINKGGFLTSKIEVVDDNTLRINNQVERGRDFCMEVKHLTPTPVLTDFQVPSGAVMQQSMIDYHENKIYIAYDEDGNGKLNLLQTDMSGRILGRMNLNDFGHGNSMGIERRNGKTYIWSECDGKKSSNSEPNKLRGTKICYFEFKDGVTANKTYGKVIDILPNWINLTLAVDDVYNQLVVRGFDKIGGTAYYHIYDLKSVVNGSPKLLKKFKEIKLIGTSALQGFDILGRFLYIIQGAGHYEKPAIDTYIQCVDLDTMKVRYTHYIDILSDMPYREIEGIKVVKRSANKYELQFGMVSEVQRPRKNHIFKYTETVIGDSLGKFVHPNGKTTLIEEGLIKVDSNKKRNYLMHVVDGERFNFEDGYSKQIIVANYENGTWYCDGQVFTPMLNDCIIGNVDKNNDNEFKLTIYAENGASVGNTISGSGDAITYENGKIVVNAGGLVGVLPSSIIEVEGISTQHLKANSINAEKIQANAISTDKLQADSITADKIQADSITSDKITANSITTSHLTTGVFEAVDAKIENATIGKAEIKDLESTNAKIENLEATKASIEELNATNAGLGTLVSETATIKNLMADKAEIKDLQATNGKIENLESENAEIKNLVAEKANISDLNAVNGKIENLESDNAKINDALIGKAEINDLNVVKADIEILNVDVANVKELTAEKANITDLNVANAKIENLETDNAKIKDLVAEKATIEELNATKVKIESLQANKADVTDLNAVNATIGLLQAGKADVTELNAVKGNITQLESEVAKIGVLESDVADIEHILAGNITAENIQTGAITAGSGIIADGAIGSAQISSLDASKISTGKIDTSKVEVAGTNNHLRIKGNRIQVFQGTGNQAKERVSLGDVNGNGSVYGLRVRGADGQTILLDENGVKSEGITDGAITNDKISDDANIDGAKLNINSVVSKINEDGTETIQGTKIEVDGARLNTKLSTITNKQNADGERITQAQSQITANTNAIKLKVDNQTYQTDKSDMTSKLNKNTSEISTMKGQIALKVEQTDIDTAKGELEDSIDSKINTAKGEIKVTTDKISQNVTNLTNTVNTKADGSTVTAINNKIGSLETSVNGISGKVTNIEKTTTTLGNQVTAAKNTADSAVSKANSAQSTANTNKGNITNLQGEVSTIKSDVAELEVTTSGISQKVSSVESTTSSLTTKVNNAQSTADSKAKVFTTTPTTPYRVGDLWVQGASGDVMRCKTARTSGSYTASDWEKASKYTDDTKANAVDNKVGTLQSEYNSTKSKVATLETNLDGITQRVSSTESTTSSLTTKVNNAQSTANTAKNTADSAKSQANTNKDNISTLQSTVTSTSNKVASLETNLNSITSRVSATETTTSTLTNKVDNMKIGGRNLIRKADVGQNNSTATFNDSTKTWTIKATAGSGGTWGSGLVLKNKNILVPYGKQYVLSFEIKVPRNCSWNTDVNNYALTGSSWAGNDNDNSSKRSTSSKSLTANQWIKCWVKWENTNANNTNKVDLYDNTNFGVVMKDETSDMTYEIRNIQGELGNVPTEYTPAPEDVDNAISAVDNKVNSANTNISNLTTRVTTAESKLTKDSLTTTIGSHYTTSTDVNGIVDKKGYQTQSQVQQTVDGLQVKVQQSGGYNLIRNSTGASGNTSNWSHSGSSMGVGSNDNIGSANKHYLYLNNGTTTSEKFAYSSRFKLKPNTKYRFTGYFHNYTKCPSFDVFVLSSTSLSDTDTTQAYTNVHHLINAQNTNGNWKKFTTTFTTPANTRSGILRIDNNGYNSSGSGENNIHWSCLTLTEGELEVPWSPHPSEVYDGITTIDKDGITVTSSNVKSKTSMSANGFKITKTDTNEDVFKVNSDGTLTLKGNMTITGGSVSDNALSSTIRNGANAGSSAKSTLDSKASGWDSAKSTVDSNSSNWGNAYNRVKEWASGAVTGSTTINGGMITANTISVNKLAVGDFTNISQIDENLAPNGNTVITHSDNYKYFRFGNDSSAGYHSLQFATLNGGTFKVGDRFKFTFIGFGNKSISTTFIIRARYTDNTWNNLGNASYTFDTANKTRTVELQITSGLTAGKTLQRVQIFNEFNNTTGLAYMRNICINRMATGELIVDGSIKTNMIHSEGLNASVIKAGTISADRLDANTIVSKVNGGTTEINGNRIQTGTLSASKITTGTLDASKATITNLNASNIKTGTLSADRLASNSITASKLSISDFTNYCEMDIDNCSNFGFDKVTDSSTGNSNNYWMQMKTLNRDTALSSSKNYEMYKGNVEGSYRITFEYNSTVTGATSSGGTNSGAYMGVGIGLYCKKKDGSSSWNIVSEKPNSSTKGTNRTVTGTVTLGSDIASFGVYMQLDGYSPFSGVVKIRNIKINKMAGGELIVNGSITADKIKVTDLSALGATIGGFNIKDGAVYSTNVGMGRSGKEWAFWAGSNTSGSAPFRVGHKGEVFASDMTITGGSITSASLSYNIGDRDYLRINGDGVALSSSANGTHIKSDYLRTGLSMTSGSASGSTVSNRTTMTPAYLSMSSLYGSATSVTIDCEDENTITTSGAISASGGFKGNATTATTLKTARTITVGNTGKSFNGSGNISFSTAEIGTFRAVSANGYQGLARPDGNTTDWIRTTQNGIIPYQSGGSSSIGTSTWQFNTIYGKTIYENGTTLSNRYLSKSGGDTITTSSGNALYIKTSTSGNPTWIIGRDPDNNNKWHVGSPNANYNLHLRSVSGAVVLRGSAVNCKTTGDDAYIQINASKFNVSSEEKWKSDITEYKNSALEKILDTTVYNYTLTKSNESAVGLVIDRGVPEEIVSEMNSSPDIENSEIATANELGEDKGIDLYAMCSLSWKAIQEQQEIIDKLKKEIEELKK